MVGSTLGTSGKGPLLAEGDADDVAVAVAAGGGCGGGGRLRRLLVG